MKIAVIGAGAMGGAIVKGMIKSDAFNNEDIIVADPNQQVLDGFKAHGVNVTIYNNVAASQADVVMIVVKPWLVEQVISAISDQLNTRNQCVIVVAAGVSSQQVSEALGQQSGFFLCIPNIAIAEQQSMTFLVPVEAASEKQETVVSLFNQLGRTLITDEQHLPAATTLASCGIAYALRYIRAAAEGGVELGFKASDATSIVAQTVLGAVELLQSTGLHPEALIDQVTTPGGVTIRGLNEMEHAGFSSAVVRGLKAGAK